MSDLHGSIERKQIPMTQEILRKLIHISSLWIPGLYILTDRRLMIIVLGSLVGVALLSEYLRRNSTAVDNFFRKYFGGFMREHELGNTRLNGATYVLISALLCVVIFPKIVAVNAFSVLIVSDTAAALIGRNFGRHKFSDKSLEGSLAFAVSAVGVTVCTSLIFHATPLYIAIGALASVVATIAEAFSSGAKIDDNFTIPVSFGFVMWGALALTNDTVVKQLLAG